MKSRLTLLAPLFILALPFSSFAIRAPEAETLRLSKILKPISDDLWKQIAGSQISQEYEVTSGDTLYDISGRLFGDSKYWPKIWSLNNKKITNPHQITPGMRVNFYPGSGSSLPSLSFDQKGGSSTSKAVADNSDALIEGNSNDFPSRGNEWKNLPRQDWESISVRLPPEIDPYGFDRNNVITYKTKKVFELDAYLQEDDNDPLGRITGSTSHGSYLASGDTVYIEADENLQIGETYTLTSEPNKIIGGFTKRKAWAYLNLGDVKILGIRDGLYAGSILHTKLPVKRGDYIVAKKGLASEPELKEGPRPIEASVNLDERTGSLKTSQFQQVFIDRGRVDGVKPGMVFRSYQHVDPSTDKKITSTDFIIHADYVVVEALERFSIATVLHSRDVVYDKSICILLTNIADLFKYRSAIGDKNQSPYDKTLDELDRLDPGGRLGPEEEKELNQLEKWISTSPTSDPSDEDEYDNSQEESEFDDDTSDSADDLDSSDTEAVEDESVDSSSDYSDDAGIEDAYDDESSSDSNDSSDSDSSDSSSDNSEDFPEFE